MTRKGAVLSEEQKEKARVRARARYRYLKEHHPEELRVARSAAQRKRRSKRRSEWVAANGPCRHCGSWDSPEIDHVDPSTKESSNIWDWPEDRRMAELAKCQILCKSCHVKKSATEVPQGEQNGSAKLDAGKVKEIRDRYSAGATLSSLARDYDVSNATMSDVVHGRSWKDVW